MQAIEVVTRLATVQHGVVGREQVRSAGVRPDAEAWLVRDGVVERASRRVLRIAGSPRTAHQSLMVAVLDAGPVALSSLWSAAWVWKLGGFSYAEDVMVLRGVSSRAVDRVHRPRLLLPHHATVVDGIPVTSLARTIFDLAAVIHPDRLARVVDNVITRSPAMGQVLHDTLPELAKRGRTGIAAMRAILRARPPGEAVPASNLERRFETILDGAGERVPRRQVDVGGHEWIGRVDYRDDHLPILFEIDSRTYHTGLLDVAADRLRDEALLAAGWAEIVRIREDDVWHRPWVVVDQVRSARRRGRDKPRSGT